MPFDVPDTGGDVVGEWGGEPSVRPERVRWLFANYVGIYEAGTFPTPAGRPNPSSESGRGPLTNLLLPQRSKRWRGRGYFCISDDTTKDFEMAPNYNLRVNEGSGDVDIDCRISAATTHFQDPRRLALHIQNQLNTSGSLSLTYTVTYDDERESGASATFLWTIAATGTFTIVNKSTDANSITTSLGFAAGGTFTGASTYTGSSRACHTEEYFIITVRDTSVTTNKFEIGPSNATDYYRYIVLVDPNFSTADWTAYVGVLAVVDDQADGSYTTNVDKFTPDWVSLDANYGRWLEKQFSASMSPIQAVDTYAAGTVYLNQTHLKIKIVDPTNAHGHVSLGWIYVGPGWHPDFNVAADWEYGTEEMSAIHERPGGDYDVAFQPPRRVARFTSPHLKQWDRRTLDHFFHGSFVAVDAGGGYDGKLVWATQGPTGAGTPMLLYNPGYTSASEEKGTGLVFGRARVSVPRGEPRAKDRGRVSVDFTETPYRGP